MNDFWDVAEVEDTDNKDNEWQEKRGSDCGGRGESLEAWSQLDWVILLCLQSTATVEASAVKRFIHWVHISSASWVIFKKAVIKPSYGQGDQN